MPTLNATMKQSENTHKAPDGASIPSVAFCGTHCDHIVVPEPYRSKYFDGLRETVLEAGNKVVFNDTFILFLAKKPL